jgi:hypothetical protein
MEETMTRIGLPTFSRRDSLKAVAAAGLCTSLGVSPSLVQDAEIKDEDIFRFALNLEYMETEYYLRATTGKGIEAVDLGSDPGPVKGGRKVDFQSKAIREFAEELAENELAHVRFYRKTLGGQAVDRPEIDLEGGFAAVAKAAGLPDFDPFANDMNFLLGGMLFEDVGVTAYAGAAPLSRRGNSSKPRPEFWPSRRSSRPQTRQSGRKAGTKRQTEASHNPERASRELPSVRLVK